MENNKYNEKFDMLERIIIRIILLSLLLIGGIKLVAGEIATFHLPVGLIHWLF